MIDQPKRRRRWFRYAMVITAATITIAAVFVLAVVWIAFDMVIHPPRDPARHKFSDFSLPSPENVNFQSDGLTFSGWFIRGRDEPTILLVHGMGGNRTEMLPHAAYLHQQGYNVALFDARYRGLSDGDYCTLGAKEHLDVVAAVRYLRERPDVDGRHIGVQGVSLGAVSAILAAESEPEAIQGVVAEIPFTSVGRVLNHTFPRLTPFPSFPFGPLTKAYAEHQLNLDFDQVDTLKAVKNISGPLLLIDDSADKLFPPNSVEELFAAAISPKYFCEIKNAPHGLGWQTNRKAYETAVLNFWAGCFERADRSRPLMGAQP